MKCPYYARCGSCRYSLTNYAYSLQDKLQRLREYISPFALGTVHEAINKYYYRHKIIYHFAQEKGQLLAGFHPRGQRHVLPIEYCYLQKEESNVLLHDCLAILRSLHFQAYDPRNRQGSLRHLLLRYAQDGKVLLCFVGATKDLRGSQNLVKALRLQHPEIIGIDYVYNPRDTSVVIEGKVRHLYGSGILWDRLGNYRFAISSSSFYQVNPPMAEIIYTNTIQRMQLAKNDVVADLYCGNGTISLFLAPYVKEVVGIEINPDAVANARQASKDNRIKNVHFLCQDATQLLQHEKFNALLVDPPRSGLSQKTIYSLCRNGPAKIAYISCNPITLLRDLRQLQRAYHVGKIHVFDQFAFTEHLEASVILERI